MDPSKVNLFRKKFGDPTLVKSNVTLREYFEYIKRVMNSRQNWKTLLGIGATNVAIGSNSNRLASKRTSAECIADDHNREY